MEDGVKEARMAPHFSCLSGEKENRDTEREKKDLIPKNQPVNGFLELTLLREQFT